MRNFFTGGQQPAAPAPTPEPQERGFFARIRDRITGAERREQERQQQDYQRQLDQYAQQLRQAERQLRDQARQQAERERQLQEREREVKERTEPRPAVRPSPAPEPQIPPALQGIPPVLALGPKGRDGAAYTTPASNAIMDRLQEAAALGKRVSLRIHDEKGWHDLFLNDKPSDGFHKPARGIRADYLVTQIGGDLDQWLGDGCAVGEEGYVSPPGDEGFENVDGFQLTVWS
jgi:hypothetical protein